MSRVLVVDDERSIRITLCEFLNNEGFEAEEAHDAETAIQKLSEKPFDVLVTDIIMPRISGIELLNQVRSKTDSIQIIIMTGEPTVETAVEAVKSGANDYLTKPIKRDEFIRAVRNCSKIKSLSDEKLILESEKHLYQKNLEDTIEKKTAALQNAVHGTISLLSAVVEFRDPYTAGHQRRVGNLSAAIAKKMGLPFSQIEMMRIIGYIHDIGKIVVPIEILAKPGRLTELEMEMIKNHSIKGHEMISKVDLPKLIGETVFQHHERCNGKGYPRGLSADEITIEAKILMVADVVEAMISHRPYRPALGVEAALDEILKNSGINYEKTVVSACLDLFQCDNYVIDDAEHNIEITF